MTALPLDGPPIVGRDYLVPCIWWPMNAGTKFERPAEWWPVFGPAHSDATLALFSPGREEPFLSSPDYPHWHIDARFLTEPMKAQHFGLQHDGIGIIADFPFNGREFPLATTLRPLRCTAPTWTFNFDNAGIIAELTRGYYAGRKCAGKPGGWICPHQDSDLSSVRPGTDGWITCPAHGLQIHAETGIVRPETPEDAERRATMKRMSKEWEEGGW